MRRSAMLVTLLLTLSCAATATGADDPPSTPPSLLVARELYAAAEYESALTMLDRLRAGRSSTEDLFAIEQYRAFCLLALGRVEEAEQAISAVVVAQPDFVPSESDISPRLQSVFGEVRRRTLPGVVRQRFERARAAFDRRDFFEAAAGFSRVLDVLSDAGLADDVASWPLSDFKVLATAFRDLSTSVLPPPLPSASLPVPDEANEPASSTAIYSADDHHVVAPVPVRQVLPEAPVHMSAGRHGAVEVVINQAGVVERVAMHGSLGYQYDRLVIGAASQWKYQPATLDGQPVKYRKVVQISVKRGDSAGR